jgi:hypothetical protein
VADQFREFQELGVGVLAISMSRPEPLVRYLAERPLPFPLLADPERKAYAAFELGRTSWSRFMRPGIAWRYTKAVLRGGKLRGIPEGEDALQTGGDFLVDRDRRLLWAYASPDPTDRPAVDGLLKVIREKATMPR